MARNKVISGDFLGYSVSTFGKAVMLSGGGSTLELSKYNVKTYEVITQDSRKSATSAVARGVGGAMLLGPAGLLAGLSAKSKTTTMLAITFKDNKQSLLEIDDKIYQKLVTSVF